MNAYIRINKVISYIVLISLFASVALSTACDKTIHNDSIESVSVISDSGDTSLEESVSNQEDSSQANFSEDNSVNKDASDSQDIEISIDDSSNEQEPESENADSQSLIGTGKTFELNHLQIRIPKKWKPGDNSSEEQYFFYPNGAVFEIAYDTEYVDLTNEEDQKLVIDTYVTELNGTNVSSPEIIDLNGIPGIKYSFACTVQGKKGTANIVHYMRNTTMYTLAMFTFRKDFFPDLFEEILDSAEFVGLDGPWEVMQFVDAFGDVDESGDKYICSSFSGSFSNTATIDSDLSGEVFALRGESLGQFEIRFRLFEYGKNKAIYYDDEIITLLVKVDNEIEEYSLVGDSPNGDLRLVDEANKFYNYLYDGEDLRCIINIGSSEYHFDLISGNFADAGRAAGLRMY